MFREVYNTPDLVSEDSRGICRTQSASSLKSFREAYNRDQDDVSLASTSEHGTTCTTPKQRRSFLNPQGFEVEEDEDSFCCLGIDHPKDAPLEPKPSATTGDGGATSISRARQRVVQSQETLKSKLVGFEQKFGEKAAIEALDGLKDKATEPQPMKVEPKIQTTRRYSQGSAGSRDASFSSCYKSQRVERGRDNSESGRLSESSDKVLQDSISVDLLTNSSHRPRRFSSTQNCSVKSVQDESISIDFLATMAEKNGFRNGPIPQYMQYRQALAKNSTPKTRSPESDPSLSLESSNQAVKESSSVGCSDREGGTKPTYTAYRSLLSKQGSSKSNESDVAQISANGNYSDVSKAKKYDRYRQSLSQSKQEGPKGPANPELQCPRSINENTSPVSGMSGANKRTPLYEEYRNSLSSRSIGAVGQGAENASCPMSPQANGAMDSLQSLNDSGYSAYRRSLSQRSSEDGEKRANSAQVPATTTPVACSSPLMRADGASESEKLKSDIYRSLSQRGEGKWDTQDESLSESMHEEPARFSEAKASVQGNSNSASSTSPLETGYTTYRRSLSQRSDKSKEGSGVFANEACSEQTGVECSDGVQVANLEAQGESVSFASRTQATRGRSSNTTKPRYMTYRRSLSQQSNGEQQNQHTATTLVGGELSADSGTQSLIDHTKPNDWPITKAEPEYMAYRRTLSQRKEVNARPCDLDLPVSDPSDSVGGLVESTDQDKLEQRKNDKDIPSEAKRDGTQNAESASTFSYCISPSSRSQVSEACSSSSVDRVLSGNEASENVSPKQSLYGNYRRSLSERSQGSDKRPEPSRSANSSVFGEKPSGRTSYEDYRRSLSFGRGDSASLEMGEPMASRSNHSKGKSRDESSYSAGSCSTNVDVSPRQVENCAPNSNANSYGQYRRSLSERIQQEEGCDPSTNEKEVSSAASSEPTGHEACRTKLSFRNKPTNTQSVDGQESSHDELVRQEVQPDETTKLTGYSEYRRSLSQQSQGSSHVAVEANAHETEGSVLVLTKEGETTKPTEYETNGESLSEWNGAATESKDTAYLASTQSKTGYANYRKNLSRRKSKTEGKHGLPAERSNSPLPQALKAASVADASLAGNHSIQHDSSVVNSPSVRYDDQSTLSPHRIGASQVMTTMASLQVQSPGSNASPHPPQIISSLEQSTSSVTSNSENPAVAAAKPKYAHMSRYLNYRLGLETQDEEEAVPNSEVNNMNSSPAKLTQTEPSSPVGMAVVDPKSTDGASLPQNVEWGSTDASALFEVWQEVESDRSKMHVRLEQKREQPAPKKVKIQTPEDRERQTNKKPLQKQHSHDIEEAVEPEKRLAMIEDERRNYDRSHQALLCCRYILFLLLLIVLPSIIGVLVRSAKRQPIMQSVSEDVAPSLSPTSAPTSAPSSTGTNTLTLNTILTTTAIPSIAPVELLLPATASRIEETVLDILVELDNQVALRTPGTPQFLAYMWLLSDHDILDKYSRARIVQRYALATLYLSTDGENWFNNENWLSDEDECTWYSISVSSNGPCNANGFMTSMDLSFNDLNGRLPPEIGLLSRLETLSLTGQNNEKAISGILPTSMGNMKSLVYLNVRGNALVGPLPSQLGNLDRLEVLDLGMNRFTLPLPRQLGNLASLRVLNLELNRVTGTLPTEVNLLTRLEQLRLGSNRMTGALAIVGSLTSLKVLNLEQNRFTSISFRGAQLPNLETLTLYDNDITSRIPRQFGGFISLRRLNLHSNSLQGPVPTELGQLQGLEELNLAYNRLTGEIPTELGVVAGLNKLELQTNRLKGNIPVTLQNLSNLSIIRLDDNNFSGAVPVEVCDSFESFSPSFYLDCGDDGQRGLPEVSCPPNSCCTFCCIDGAGCQCTYDEEHAWMCFNSF